MTISVIEILKQTDALTSDEQLTLASMLIEQARKKSTITKPRHKWVDAIGTAPYPLMGEDAQTWVSRTREEGDTLREKQWRKSE